MAHCMRCTSPASCDVWGCVPGTFSSEPKDPRVAREMQHLFDACVPQPPRASTSTASTTPPATLAMRQFADAGRRYVARRGRRRMPAQLRMRGPRGRARVLQARRDSLGFVLAAYLAEFNHKSDDYEVLAEPWARYRK